MSANRSRVHRRFVPLHAAAVVALFCIASPARATVDADADVVSLRTDCTEAGNALDNCFTTMSALKTWINGTRHPSAAAPLLVRVGPGGFGKYSCANSGWVTLRGSGREQTVIGAGLTQGAAINNCQQLAFENLTIRGDEIGVSWTNGGGATWTDVDLVGGTETGQTANPAYAWQDFCAPGYPQPLHYFFDSRLVANASNDTTDSVVSACAEVWFYGGEIVARGTADTPSSITQLAAIVQIGSAWHVFGANIRTRVEGAVQTTVASPPGLLQGFGGVAAAHDATFHMHGGIISIDASPAQTNFDVFGVGSFDYAGSPAALVHTPGTAFIVKAAGTGAAVRATGPNVQSPFLWQAGSSPPVAGLQSLAGQDLFVETDCGSSTCDNGGTEPHLMIYRPQCTGSPWFDVVRGACRN